MDSSLVNRILAGLPVFQVTTAGYTSDTDVCFAPNPPPMRGLITRTLLFGISRALARIRRTWNGTWVDETTLSLPYASR